DDHWRVVRQPEPLRRAAGVQAHRGAEPADYELDGLRPLGARRLGARRGGEPRRRALRLRDVSVLPGQHRVSVLRVLFKGHRGGIADPEGVRVPGRLEPLAEARRVAAEARYREVPSPARGRQALVRPAGGGWRCRTAYDEYVSDPAKPVPYTKE